MTECRGSSGCRADALVFRCLHDQVMTWKLPRRMPSLLTIDVGFALRAGMSNLSLVLVYFNRLLEKAIPACPHCNQGSCGSCALCPADTDNNDPQRRIFPNSRKPGRAGPVRQAAEPEVAQTTGNRRLGSDTHALDRRVSPIGVSRDQAAGDIGIQGRTARQAETGFMPAERSRRAEPGGTQRQTPFSRHADAGYCVTVR